IGRDAEQISQADVDGSDVLVDVGFEVADLVVPIQLDLWAATRTQRGELGEAVRALFTDPDIGDDMRLTLADYHDRLATFQIEGWRNEDSGASAERKEWRQTINLTLE